MSLKQLYTLATFLVTLGYLLFFFADTFIFLITGAGMLLFFGQAFIQLLILMCFADTVKYGKYKNGRRNDSITFSLQPLLNKAGGAITSAIVGLTIVYSGVKDATSKTDLTATRRVLFKTSMITVPLVLIIISYIVYAKKFTIDDRKYAEIIKILQQRKQTEASF